MMNVQLVDELREIADWFRLRGLNENAALLDHAAHTVQCAVGRIERDEALLRQALDVLSRTHQTAMEQAMKARVLEGVVFAEIFQDLDFVVTALRERLGSTDGGVK